MEITTNMNFIITLILTNISFSFYYFFIYYNTKKQYIAIWGFGWVIYSLGFLLYILFTGYNISILLKYFFSIVSSLFLLSGTLLFINYKHFFRFVKISIFIILLTLAACYLISTGSNLISIQDKGHLSIFFSLFTGLNLSIISVWSGIIFLTNKSYFSDDLKSEYNIGTIQHITGWAFIFWGIHKGFYPFINPLFYNSQWNYMTSIVLTIIVNLSMILSYISQNNIEIARSQSIYRFLTENSQDIIAKVSLSPEINFSYISPAVYAITGYSQSEFYTNPSLFTDIIYIDDRSIFEGFLSSSIKSSDPSIIFRLVKKDGKVIWIEQHTTIISSILEKNTSVTCVVILRNISDRMKIEENLFRSETSRRHLMANISHELKSPITSIIGYLSIISDNIGASLQNYDSYIKACLNKSLMLDTLIEDLFELSKLEAHQLKFDFCSFKAGILISEIYEHLYTDIENFGTKPQLINNCSEKCLVCPIISVDKSRIEQVFRNLVTNSINNTPPNGYISLQCYCNNRQIENSPLACVTFAVEDNGRGIDKVDLPFIFERFYKKNSSTNKGTGLGLSICKEIINAHKGEIWAESSENKKTTIFFTLPIWDERR